MTDFHADADKNLFFVNLTDSLNSELVQSIRNALDDYINAQDQVPNIVIDAVKLPHWDSWSAFRDHFDLVHDHHRLVKKVAVVGDHQLLNILPGLLDHFVQAKVQHFSARNRDAAIAWASKAEAQPGAFVILDGFPRDVIAVDVVGVITSRDYREVLRPLVEERLKSHDEIKFYCRVGEGFDHYSAGAMWDDLRLGFGHMLKISRMALVTDVEWLTHGARFFAPVIPCDIVVFPTERDDEARDWIKW